MKKSLSLIIFVLFLLCKFSLLSVYDDDYKNKQNNINDSLLNDSSNAKINQTTAFNKYKTIPVQKLYKYQERNNSIDKNNKNNKGYLDYNFQKQLINNDSNMKLVYHIIDPNLISDDSNTRDSLYSGVQTQNIQNGNTKMDQNDDSQSNTNQFQIGFKNPEYKDNLNDILPPNIPQADIDNIQPGSSYTILNKSYPQQKPSSMSKFNCNCFSSFSCPTCGGASFSDELFNSCPCAKSNCKPCVPLSKLHDLSIQKATKDKRLIETLKIVSNRLDQTLQNLSNQIDDVIKYEKEAKGASELLEETKIMALIAKNQMKKNSEKAKLIAKESIFQEEQEEMTLATKPQKDYFSIQSPVLSNTETSFNNGLELPKLLDNYDVYDNYNTLDSSPNSNYNIKSNIFDRNNNRFSPEVIDSITNLVKENQTSVNTSFSLNFDDINKSNIESKRNSDLVKGNDNLIKNIEGNEKNIKNKKDFDGSKIKKRIKHHQSNNLNKGNI